MTAPCPTPRCDEFVQQLYADDSCLITEPEFDRMVAFARQLERELAAARALPAGAAIDECEDALRGLVNDVSRRAAFGRLRASLPQAPRNQCDGCARGLPVGNSGLHLDPTTDKAIMACTAHLYSPAGAVAWWEWTWPSGEKEVRAFDATADYGADQPTTRPLYAAPPAAPSEAECLLAEANDLFAWLAEDPSSNSISIVKLNEWRARYAAIDAAVRGKP